MQVQVIIGNAGPGKNTTLQEIQADLARQEIEVPIVVGAAYTTPYFLNLIASHAIAGAKYFLADDCTNFQIKAVLDLAAKEEKSGLPDYLVVHLVRQT
ncbi:hypothetical protein HBO12_12230 [Pseudomonas sp. WS 5059]|uniref:hypothetical protein n=1 Tax=Pseudomonas sp. WS 5059 TaxID=2717491 RepID=UPI001475D209|nr:hypothetical protein [Pseudomonas sp. WS 5059]NMY03723.1 hypothetical protein [Pseudomonas sp. WS 5059]